MSIKIPVHYTSFEYKAIFIGTKMFWWPTSVEKAFALDLEEVMSA